MSDETRRPKEVPVLDQKTLDGIAEQIHGGGIFCDRHIPNQPGAAELGKAIFLPLSFGAFSEWTAEEVKNVGMIYEYMSKADPERNVNGFPVFTSFQMLNNENALYVYSKILELQAGTATDKKEE